MRAKYINGEFVLSLRDKNINEIDSELTSLYESEFNDIAGKYQSGGLDWLNENHPGLYATIEQAEKKLNEVWDRTLKGKATVNNFKTALCQWHKAQMKGIEEYKLEQLII